MKNIYIILIVLLTMNCALVSCSDVEPYSTADINDNPRILDPTFIDRVNGELPVIASINRDANFSMNLVVTPADYCTVSWLIDNDEVHIGKSIDKNFKAGNYHLKVIVTTQTGKSTSREGILKVNPLNSDPWSDKIGFERIVGVGRKAYLYGNNLNIINKIIIDNHTINNLNYDNENGVIEYIIPNNLDDGTYRIILVDNSGFEYGGDLIQVFDAPVIYMGSERTNANQEWIMNGINLDKITQMTFAQQTITTFISQSESEISFKCPNLEEGEYTLTGTTKEGMSVQFYCNDTYTTEQSVIISAETELWSGHHYVSWEYEDGNPNKTFNLINKEAFSSIKAGATLYVYCSIATDASYHQVRTTTGWWSDLAGTSAIDLTEDRVIEVQLTQNVLDQIQAEDGFICVGHGYFVDRVAIL